MRLATVREPGSLFTKRKQIREALDFRRMTQLLFTLLNTFVCSAIAQNYAGYQYNPALTSGAQYPQYQSSQGQYQYQNPQPYQGQQYQYDQPMQQGSIPAQIQQFPQNQQYQQPQQYQQNQQPQQYQQNQQYPQNEQNQNQQYQQDQGQYNQPSTTPNPYRTCNCTTQYGVNQAYQSTTMPSNMQYDSQQKDCNAPRAPGNFCAGAQQRQMFYYDSNQKVCQPFMYNGCNGNGNRFETAAECKQMCIDNKGANTLQRNPSSSMNAAMQAACQAQYDVEHLTPRQCSNGQGCQNGYQCTSGFCCPTPSYLCNLRYDSGRFVNENSKSDRYFYTSQYKTCMRFSYYGSQGNENNFLDYNSCMRTCQNQQ
ncbi:unnamed protein product [Cylicocyclus nassatus]|uniref:BPTI/Kunitz inhibitor domain-containing protein n=1 Tax=Cylicocyclus nassatus TaxID=53992 RepID=A0AA36GDR9_CYLNA|nr:unnamed protein product [Cylicocyclus nassatus]